MTDRSTPPLTDLAEAIAAARVRGFEDLYLERTLEAWWDSPLEPGRPHGSLRRTGAAVRRGGALYSADGLDRLGLAALLDVSPRLLPPVEVPDPPPPPAVDAVAEALPPGAWSVRWRWRWAAVMRAGRVFIATCPSLVQLTSADGQRYLCPWPLPESWRPGAEPAGDGQKPHAGPTCALLAPAPATALLHEMVGHPLEADVVGAGASLWQRRRAERLLAIPLNVADDPTDWSLPGSFSADDEGTAAKRRELLRDGVLVGVLADRAAAAALGVPSGSARRSGVHARPRPRMSNLVAAAQGGEGVEALRAEARIEVTAVSGASFDPGSGLVHIEVRRATARPRHGKPRPLPPFTLRGVFDEVCGGLLACSTVTAPSYSPGWCGKNGDAVAVGGRAPWLLTRGLSVL